MTNDDHIQQLIKELWNGKQCLEFHVEYYVLKPNLPENNANYQHSRKLYRFDKHTGKYKALEGNLRTFFAKVIEFGNYSLKDLK